MPSQADFNSEVVATLLDINKRLKVLESVIESIPSDQLDSGESTTLISSADISGNNSITIENISGDYAYLKLIWTARTDGAVGSDTLLLRFNRNEGAYYSYAWEEWDGVDWSGNIYDAQTSIWIANCPDEASGDDNGFTTATLEIYFPSEVARHTVQSNAITVWAIDGTTTYKVSGTFELVEAVSSITIMAGYGLFAAGSKYALYGISN